MIVSFQIENLHAGGSTLDSFLICVIGVMLLLWRMCLPLNTTPRNTTRMSFKTSTGIIIRELKCPKCRARVQANSTSVEMVRNTCVKQSQCGFHSIDLKALGAESKVIPIYSKSRQLSLPAPAAEPNACCTSTPHEPCNSTMLDVNEPIYIEVEGDVRYRRKHRHRK